MSNSKVKYKLSYTGTGLNWPSFQGQTNLPLLPVLLSSVIIIIIIIIIIYTKRWIANADCAKNVMTHQTIKYQHAQYWQKNDM
jgi:hypothetical protein